MRKRTVRISCPHKDRPQAAASRVKRNTEGTVVVTSMAAWNHTGGGQTTQKIAEALHDLGYGIIFASCAATLGSDEDGIDVVHLRGGRLDFPSDCVGVVGMAYNHSGLAVMSKAQSAGIPFLYHSLDWWAGFDNPVEFDESIECELWCESDYVSASARKLISHLNDAYGDREDALYIANAGDSSYLKRRWVERPKDVSLVYCGSVYGEWHDWDIVFDIKATHPDWMVSIVGPGPDHLIDEFRRAGIDYHPPVPHKELPIHIEDASVGIIPFHTSKLCESVHPLKMHDYLMLGRPVVSSWMPEVAPFPYTFMPSPGEWYSAIEKAHSIDVSKTVVDTCYMHHTWEDRALSISDEVLLS